MESTAREVLDASMRWMDELWDDGAALLWSVRRDRHMTRETAWYALGLLQRAEPGDGDRAERALRSVVAQQFAADRSPYGGTFRRAPEEDDPPDDPVMWVHYDPNWRQFIGTTMAVIVDRYGDGLAGALVDDLRRAIERAVEGEPEDRVAPTYANIALMKARLDGWSGRAERSEALAAAIHEHFDEHGAFLEYNSPTYYGIDLFALALWRDATPALQRFGADIEQRLWRDIARFYHTGLRNLCGPYDRAYGMDMTAYATPLGLYVWSAVGRDLAPFPDTTTRFGHPHDLCFGPLVAAVPSRVPDAALDDLVAFRGERQISRTISEVPRRVATAWLGADAMIGAHAGPPSGIGWLQHCHATVHTPDGWVRLLPDTGVEATATAHALELRGVGPITLEIAGDPRFDLESHARPRVGEGNGRRRLTFETEGEQTVVLRV